MAITKLTTDLNYHQALGNLPNSDDGLTAEVLKERYDQGVNDIKEYVNDVLTAEVDAALTSRDGNLNTHKTSGDHDGRYYTETEIDTKVALLETKADLTGNRKLSPSGDFTGTLNGYEIVAADPGLSSAFVALQADVALILNPSGSDDTTAIRNAVTTLSTRKSKTLVFNSGDYSYDTTIGALSLPSDCTLIFMPDAIVQLIGTGYFISTDSKSNININGGKIIGSGVNGNFTFYFSNCSNVHVYKTEITDSSSIGIKLAACSNCTIEEYYGHANYKYAGEDQTGVNNLWLNCRVNDNGVTSKASSVNGRGIVFWSCTRCKVVGGEIKNNNEYGFRYYSQAGDITSNTHCSVSNVHFQDNTTIDVYYYNDSGAMKYNDLFNCHIKRTIAGTAISNQGEGNKIYSNTLEGDSATISSAFVMFGAQKTKVYNNKMDGFVSVFNWSPTSKCNGNEVYNNEARNCKTVSRMNGSDNILRNNTCYHVATAAVATEVGFEQSDNSTGTIVDGNKFYGFHSGIYLVFNVDITVMNNIVRASVHSNFRTGLLDMHLMTILNNDVDGFGSSSIMGSLNSRGKNKGYYFRSIAIPSTTYSTLTFAVGDIGMIDTPVAGAYAEWMCTAAGTPGTWKGKGILEA